MGKIIEEQDCFNVGIKNTDQNKGLYTIIKKPGKRVVIVKWEEEI